jgi:LuxR family maltose regulon positive regulatory protein
MTKVAAPQGETESALRAIPRFKFGCPAVPTRAIERPRLTAALAPGDWRVALVTGGPATGKTVLMAQWFEALGTVPREWVTLDNNDDLPQRFWLTFALALERAASGAFADTVTAASDVHAVRPDFLDQLMIEWSALKEPLVMVLDDAHCLRDPAIVKGLSFVVEQLPPGSRLVLTSRVDLSLPIGRWRGRSWLVELRHRDLACTLDETTSLLAALGEDRLNASEVELLWQHTEGWVAGLRLAVAGFKDRADLSAAVKEFSGRDAVIAELLADEILYRAPEDLADFLLRTSVTDILDAELCDALSGRTDSGEVLRAMEAELKFVIATRSDRSTYRYHPLLAQMLRAELSRRHPEDVTALNRAAAAVLEKRGDVVGAVRCLLAAGATDQAFSIVSQAAYYRADVGDTPGIAAFVNLFPRELVTESCSRMLIYALMLGLSGQLEEGHAWLQRARVRMGDERQRRPEDAATLDVLRLGTFAVTAGSGEEIDAGRRALEALENGLDLGVVGARARTNLVRGYLLVDEPSQADSTLRAGNPGDEVAALLVAPALAARIALRHGRLREAEHQATTALQAARAFGLETHTSMLDANLAFAGIAIDRNDSSGVTAAFERLDEILQANPFALVYQVLFRIERARAAAAQGNYDEVFATVSEAGTLIEHLPGSVLRRMLDAVAARWHLQAGQTHQAEELITQLPDGDPAHTLLRARLDLVSGRFEAVRARLKQASPATMRDQLVGELLLARAAIECGEESGSHLTLAVGLAAPERLVRVLLEEGPAVTRLARSTAESLRTESGSVLALALGMPPRPRHDPRQSIVVLSERELSLLRFLPSRLTYSEMAAECFMSVNTAKTHLKSIYAKLGVSSRAEAVSQATLLGLL